MDIDYGEIVMIKYEINRMVFLQDLTDNKYILSNKSVDKIKSFWESSAGASMSE